MDWCACPVNSRIAKRAAISHPHGGEFGDMVDVRYWQGVAYVIGVEIGCRWL
jgi:hypothetical protein